MLKTMALGVIQILISILPFPSYNLGITWLNHSVFSFVKWGLKCPILKHTEILLCMCKVTGTE